MARELSNPSGRCIPRPGFSHVAIAEGHARRPLRRAARARRRTSRSPADDLRGQTVKAMRNVEIAMRAAGRRLGRHRPADDLHARTRPSTR